MFIFQDQDIIKRLNVLMNIEKTFGYVLLKNLKIIRRYCSACTRLYKVPAAIGYSQLKKLNFELGLIRNHYVGRNFRT